MSNPDSTASGLAGVQAYWEKKATAETDDCARIESGARGQRMRFENFALQHDLTDASVLDIGCGVGDFHEHLQRRTFRGTYVGIDLAEGMIARCRERFPAARFERRDLLSWPTDERWDYTVALAIHNIRMPGGRELLENVTRRQFDLCRRAAHVDLLTDRYAPFDSHIQAWRAEDVFAFALSITPYVVLRHDYLPNSFSVTLYREPLIDTRGGLLLD
jgi:SAM-dependent methyltransferase